MLRLALVLAAMCCTGLAHADSVKIPMSVLEAGWKQAKCDVELKDEDREGESLGGGLLIVEIYCWRAAYQAGSIFFAVDPKSSDKARLLEFQEWGGKRLIKGYSLTSPDYDEKRRVMASFHKGRGVGDCGSLGEWKWSGKAFRLTGYWRKPN